MNVGVVGCGVIAARYVEGADAFDTFDVVACSDTDSARSDAIAALLGPFAEATGFGSTPTRTRTLAVGPRAGETFEVEVPTHVTATIRLVSGALATLTVGFESRNQYESGLVVYGTEGVLALPDANQFEGALRVRPGGGE